MAHRNTQKERCPQGKRTPRHNTSFGQLSSPDPAGGSTQSLDRSGHILSVMGSVSSEDRRVMKRQGDELRSLESVDPGTEAQRTEAIDSANGDRRRAGHEELKTEGEVHRKAVALGLVRR
jgi:hypothetical protein